MCGVQRVVARIVRAGHRTGGRAGVGQRAIGGGGAAAGGRGTAGSGRDSVAGRAGGASGQASCRGAGVPFRGAGRADADRAPRSGGSRDGRHQLCRQPRVAGADGSQDATCGASAATADAGDSVAGQARCVAGGPPAPRPRGPPRQDGACHLGAACSAAGVRAPADRGRRLRHPGRCVLPLGR
ncbi:Uncharacterised protein [Mycobacterium tuberculosis]|nr:Uncharacterised protein [Mycobacterium tuberculosis]